jgi:hypothetical protein
MPDAIQPRLFLVIGVNYVPRGLLSIGILKYHVLRFRILDPTLARPGLVVETATILEKPLSEAQLLASLRPLLTQKEPG